MKCGGTSLFKEHSSLVKALRAAFPEHKWHSSRFAEVAGRQPRGFWNSIENQREYVEAMEKQLNIEQVCLLLIVSRVSFCLMIVTYYHCTTITVALLTINHILYSYPTGIK